MKKWICVLGVFLVIGLLAVPGCFVFLEFYYTSYFPVNTWINGVYCTGKTVEEVNEELANQTEEPIVTIVGPNGQSWQFGLGQIDGKADYTAALTACLREKSELFWPGEMQNSTPENLVPSGYSWDSGKSRAVFGKLVDINRGQDDADSVKLEYTDEGYVLKDEVIYRLDGDRAFAYLEECLSGGEMYVDLMAAGCYEIPEESQTDRELRKIWSRLQEYFDVGIVYDMGTERIPLTPGITSRFLVRDEDGLPALDPQGEFVLDEEEVRAWVEELAERYNTRGTVLDFQTTRGDVVSVAYDTYGTELDVEAEAAFLVSALAMTQEKTAADEIRGSDLQRTDDAGNHIPAYKHKGFVRGADDIGSTYIEIDMTQQHMYYYVDGDLVLDTDVVTGNMKRGRGTPEGINYVYNKQRNRILRGEDYVSPVKYWMPVRGAIGIHDAGWRSKFGGEIYRTDGSHGCINTPGEMMSQLYEMVEIGTPVVMFY